MSFLTFSARNAIKQSYLLLVQWVLVMVLTLIGSNPLLADTTTDNPVVLHHDLTLVPDLAQAHLKVTDTITFSTALKQPFLVFKLNRRFTVSIDQTQLNPVQTFDEFAVYRLEITDYTKPLTLTYQGNLDSTTQCNWLTEACRLFNNKGIYLDPASTWYVDFANALHTFKLQVTLPEYWQSLSQGTYQDQAWQESQPQTGIYLVAARFISYHQQQDGIEYSVYLKQPDPELALRYLKASLQHLTDLQRFLGKYPYQKFAVVESFWETGWGMPSFTLLGSKVMRLPFILNSSLPHEIAHNWWGNSVYVNSQYGNWSEGLTAYLADHYQSAVKGEDTNYRRNQLIKLSTYLQNTHPQPLSTFTSRHDQASQALGYSKSMMLFHMLNKELGEEVFLKALQTFYQRYQFKHADFKQLEQVFSEVSQRDFSTFFKQWRDQTSLPQLQLREAHIIAPHRVAFTLKQIQPDFTGVVTVPVVINSQSAKPELSTVTLSTQEQRFELSTLSTPTDIAIDPYFDVLRLPVAAEIPPTLDYFLKPSTAPRTIVIAHQARPEMLKEWQAFAKESQGTHPNWNIQFDNEPLPEGDLMVLGGESEVLTQLVEQTNTQTQLNQLNEALGQAEYFCGLHTLAAVLRFKERHILHLAADHPLGLQRLLTKLPHYGSYSYAIFNSTTGENIAKGQWEVLDSPLRRTFASPQ